METFSISHTTRRIPPHCGISVLRAIKERIVGKQYQLSLVFIGTTRSRTLNQTYRQKDYPTNVLAFPLDDSAGEIFITTPKVRHEAQQFGRTPRDHVCALFIHACLHLKGYQHGPLMEKKERQLIKQFIPS